MSSHAVVNATGPLLVRKANGLTLHYVNVYVKQVAPAQMERYSITLLVRVNALQYSNAVRAKSLIQTHVAAFVRIYKRVHQVSNLIQNYVSVYVKEAILKMSGMICFRNVREITIRSLASSHVAVNAQSTYSVTGRRSLTLTLADVCAHHLLVPVQRS